MGVPSVLKETAKDQTMGLKTMRTIIRDMTVSITFPVVILLCTLMLFSPFCFEIVSG
jgi:hypothetical protein